LAPNYLLMTLIRVAITRGVTPMETARSPSGPRKSHVNRRKAEEKKKDHVHLFFIKFFECLRFIDIHVPRGFSESY
jgi:hypothetical protein